MPVSPLPTNESLMTASESLDDHPLGKTAQFVAACRATEGAKPANDRQFNDPWAIDFAGVAGVQMLETIRKLSAATAAGLEGYVIERTPFLDEVLKEALTKSDMRQVVIAAVGGDARPYRIDFPQGTVLYQMDFPEVIRYRSTVFESAQARAKCDLRSVRVDLSQGGWHRSLTAAGFDPSKPSVWIVEGLLMYLTTVQCDSFISKIESLCQSGSSIFGDLFTKEFVTGNRSEIVNKWWSDCGASSPMFYIEEPQTWFSRYEFEAELRNCEDLGAEFGVDKKGKATSADFDFSSPEDGGQPSRPLYFKATKKAKS